MEKKMFLWKIFFYYCENKLSLFDPTGISVEEEKNASLSLFAKMDSDQKKIRKEPPAEETELNIRKSPKGGLALEREIPQARAV